MVAAPPGLAGSLTGVGAATLVVVLLGRLARLGSGLVAGADVRQLRLVLGGCAHGGGATVELERRLGVALPVGPVLAGGS